MRNPQGHYSIDALFYKALQVVARKYGVSYSDYVAKALLPILKVEMMTLDIPLEEIFDQVDAAYFVNREVNSRYSGVLSASPFLHESEEVHEAFRNYVYQKSLEMANPKPKQYSTGVNSPNNFTLPEKFLNPANQVKAPEQVVRSDYMQQPSYTPSYSNQQVVVPTPTEQPGMREQVPSTPMQPITPQKVNQFHSNLPEVEGNSVVPTVDRSETTKIEPTQEMQKPQPLVSIAPTNEKVNVTPTDTGDKKVKRKFAKI